jgi:hypothetical protein
MPKPHKGPVSEKASEESRCPIESQASGKIEINAQNSQTRQGLLNWASAQDCG